MRLLREAVYHANGWLFLYCVCDVSAIGKVSDYQPEGPGFNPRPGRGLNFGRPSFVTTSVDRDVKPLDWTFHFISGYFKEPSHLSTRVG